MRDSTEEWWLGERDDWPDEEPPRRFRRATTARLVRKLKPHKPRFAKKWTAPRFGFQGQSCGATSIFAAARQHGKTNLIQSLMRDLEAQGVACIIAGDSSARSKAHNMHSYRSAITRCTPPEVHFG